MTVRRILLLFVTMLTMSSPAMAAAETAPASAKPPAVTEAPAAAKPSNITNPPPAEKPAVDAQIKSDTDGAACSELKKHETELQAMLQYILTENADKTDLLNKLRVSQRAWLEYRKAHLEALFPDDPTKDASVRSTCSCRISSDLTKARVVQLRSWVDGVPESEPCAGTRKSSKPE
jgi:uncharacterized protein YecT (DUF1311 family)